MPGLRKAGETFRNPKTLVIYYLLMSFSFVMDNPTLFKALHAGEVVLNLLFFVLLSSRLFPVNVHLFGVHCPETRWNTLAKALPCGPEQKGFSTCFTGWTHVCTTQDKICLSSGDMADSY